MNVDEDKLSEVLQEYVGYHRPEALAHDSDCLTAIHRLRGGASLTQIEACRAIFVTSNHRVAAGAARFIRDEYGDHKKEDVPYFILDHVFTAMVWLKRPLKAPDLARKRIIADCFAALNPPNELWRKLSEEIERLQQRGDITEEDYHLLRLSLPARQVLMKTTRGVPGAVSAQTVSDMLERANQAARAGVESALESALADNVTIQSAAATAEAEASAALHQAVTDRQAAELEAMELRRSSLRQRQRARGWGSLAGRLSSRLFKLTCMIVLGVGGFFALTYPDLPGGVWLAICMPILVLSIGFGLLSQFRGDTINAIARPIEVNVANFVEDRIKALFGLPDET